MATQYYFLTLNVLYELIRSEGDLRPIIYHRQQNIWYPQRWLFALWKLHSTLAVSNLLAHNNISQICYCGQISLQSAAVNCSYCDNLTPLGVSFILLAIVNLPCWSMIIISALWMTCRLSIAHHFSFRWSAGILLLIILALNDESFNAESDPHNQASFTCFWLVFAADWATAVKTGGGGEGREIKKLR